MTKHDTWVKLKPGNPYEPILDLFPSAMIPMRDPFPLERSQHGSFSLWIIDLERLTSIQASALAQVIAAHTGAPFVEVVKEASAKGGFAMNHNWVKSMQGGAECMQRTKELADFLENAPRPPSAEAWVEFYNDQHERWIEGEETPPPINSLEDVDPRLRTPELVEAMRENEINKALAGYSVFDVLSGRAMVEILNKQNPDQHWSIDPPDEPD